MSAALPAIYDGWGNPLFGGISSLVFGNSCLVDYPFCSILFTFEHDTFEAHQSAHQRIERICVVPCGCDLSLSADMVGDLATVFVSGDSVAIHAVSDFELHDAIASIVQASGIEKASVL